MNEHKKLRHAGSGQVTDHDLIEGQKSKFKLKLLI